MKKQLLPILAILILLLLLGWYIDHIAHNEITIAVRYIVYTIALVAIIFVVGLLGFAAFFALERLLKERANRHLAEREAKVMYLVANEGQQVYIREMDADATWRNAHLDVRVYANGQTTPPQPAEVIAWQTYILRHRANVTSEVAPQLLPASTPAVPNLTFPEVKNDLLSLIQ